MRYPLGILTWVGGNLEWCAISRRMSGRASQACRLPLHRRQNCRTEQLPPTSGRLLQEQRRQAAQQRRQAAQQWRHREHAAVHRAQPEKLPLTSAGRLGKGTIGIRFLGQDSALKRHDRNQVLVALLPAGAPQQRQGHRLAQNDRLQASLILLTRCSVQTPPAEITMPLRRSFRLKTLREMCIHSSWKKETRCLWTQPPETIS